MAYPPAPWTLQGYSIQTLHLFDIAKVHPFVPSELEIISVLPGKTLGGIYAAFYALGSTLTYSELIIVSAVTRYAGKFGTWISHIYVDNADSMEGGREIWGLPKELAQFRWELGECSGVNVHQGDQLLCSISYDWQLPQWRQPLSLPSFSALGSNLLSFEGKGEIGLSLIGVKVQIPVQSPFSTLGLDQPLLGFYGNQLRLLATAPVVIGERSVPFSESRL
ncbi:acetoacetate decarboxylase family protein [Coleofasciculus sp. G2-EDA-02]|uniref:acetoacetate decarboxylase family protein n=1 Tax=Coleofasciculus sp. G2-EDA-02 TaxID=3069529 RepID=UPI0032FBFA93